MYYPFHPLTGKELSVKCKSHHKDGTVTVVGPDDVTLKIPLWMTEKIANKFSISKQIEIDPKSLLSLSNFIKEI